jgi:hypothetical protein
VFLTGGWSWTEIFLPMPSVYLRSQVSTTMPDLFFEMGASLTFCLGWPWAEILQISASLAAGITSVRHYTWSLLNSKRQNIACQILDALNYIGENIFLLSNRQPPFPALLDLLFMVTCLSKEADCIDCVCVCECVRERETIPLRCSSSNWWILRRKDTFTAEVLLFCVMFPSL